MGEPIAVFREPRPLIRQVPVDRPWQWLAAGWRDLLETPRLSLACGLVPVLAGWLAAALLIWLDLPYLLVPLGAGFFFVGPFIAVGLYEISRRRELGSTPGAEDVAYAWKRNPEQIAFMGMFFLLFHLAWMRVAQLLFALFDFRTVPSWDRFSEVVWYSSRSLPFLACGVVCGAVLAAIAFAVGAFAIPYLLDRRESNVFEAIATSVAAVKLNLQPMLLWAALIVILTAFGMVPGLVGLAITVPLVGHATWHAYRDVVVFRDGQGAG